MFCFNTQLVVMHWYHIVRSTKSCIFCDNFEPANFEDLGPQTADTEKPVELVLCNNRHHTNYNKVMILNRNSSDESVAEPRRSDSFKKLCFSTFDHKLQSLQTQPKLFFSTFGDQTAKSSDSTKSCDLQL